MNNQSRHKQKEQQAAETQGQSSVREFAGAEEALRFDASQTKVPVRVAERLNESIAAEGRASKPWWKRIFQG